jgi:alpha-galactosidase
MNKPFKPESAGLVGYCNGPAQDMNWEVAKDEIDCAAEAGAELFWLDALWYAPEGADWNPSVGDWELSEARFPEGLEPVRKYVHERGMKFGLWMEPERAGKDSKVYREHPEWFIKSCNGDMKPQLDLSKAEVVEWMEGKITGLIERYKLDFFRLDCNMHLREGGSNLKDSYLENTVWRYYQNFYDMWERVTSKFPEVIFQNCAGGGGRTDLGLVKYFDNTWVTDWQLAPRSCSITNGMSMALPPERVCRLLGMEQGTHRAGNLDFQIRSAILVHPEVSWLKPKGSEHNEVNLSKLKHGLDIYKNFIRPIQAESRVFHHTPQLEGGEDPTGWWVIELASADRTKSVAGLFRMSEPAGDTYHLTFKGLQISKRYKVTFDNSGDSLELSGFELVNRGLEVKISSALMSELIIVEAVV